MISASAEINDTSSTTSASSTRAPSVYRKESKPLSQEALYRAQQKYGVYQSPARQTGSGVTNAKAASDAAANLANNNRTTIEAYKRVLDSNASKAATAVASRSRSSSVASTVTVATTSTKSTNAAVKALAAKPAEVPVAKKTNMDMSKILSGAEAAAEKRMGSRMKPEKVVYVTSKDSGKAAERSFSLTPEILDKFPTKKALEAETAAESDPKHYASKAAYAVRDFDPNEVTEKELLEREKKKQAYFGMLTSPQVLSLARTNAQSKLESIDRAAPGSLYRNEEFNKLAVALAQKNSSQRSEHVGKINMGGGLWLTQADVQNIAQGLITPVLDEVDSRALQQRAIDEDIKQRKIDYKEQNAAWIELNRNKLTNDKMYSRETRLRHKRETDGLHTRTERKFQDLCNSKDSEVAEMEKALQDAKDSYAALQKQMEQKLEDERLRVETEMNNLKQEQEEDLVAARAEQDEILKPFVDDVTAAEAEHERLIGERESLKKAIEDLYASHETNKTKIEELEQEIVDAEKKHEEEQKNLEDLAKHKEDFSEEIEQHFTVVANTSKEKAQQSSEEARVKQQEVETMINERQSELNATELQLKKERLTLLEAMRGVTELKGEDKLDEEKVKALVGTTSDEFIKAQKKEVSAPTDTFDKTQEHSASTKSIKNENGVLDVNHKTLDNTEKSTDKPKITSSGPAKPSMVDAVLPKDFKPEVTSKAHHKAAQPKVPAKESSTATPNEKGEVKRSSSIKTKIFNIIKGGDSKTTSTSSAAAKTPTPVKKEVKTTKASDKKEIEKIAQGGPAPETEVASKATHVAAAGKSGHKEPVTASFGIDKSELHKIAQGGPAPEPVGVKHKSNVKSNGISVVHENSDEEEDLPDSSEAGENHDVAGEKKGSLFKEIF